jgi:iron complex outermembrane receptor protein
MAKSDLQPQKGQHYEMGLKHYVTPNLHVSLTLFNAEIDNEIFYNPLTYSNENHPGTLRRGIETGVRAEFFKGLTLFGNYSYVEATFKEDPYKGNDIPAVPGNRVNLGFIVNNIFKGLIFSADYNYVGASYAISDQANAFEKVEQYYTIDARLSYNWRSVKAFLGINNITNRKYAVYGVIDTFLTTRNFYPAPERNWTAGLDLMF